MGSQFWCCPNLLEQLWEQTSWNCGQNCSFELLKMKSKTLKWTHLHTKKSIKDHSIKKWTTNLATIVNTRQLIKSLNKEIKGFFITKKVFEGESSLTIQKPLEMQWTKQKTVTLLQFLYLELKTISEWSGSSIYKFFHEQNKNNS